MKYFSVIEKFFNITKPLDSIHLNTDFNNYLIISPMVSFAKRGWGLENYKLLVEQLIKQNNIMIVGAENEKKYLKYVAGKSDNVRVITPVLDEIPSLINKCRLLIGNDSGLTHIALKIGKPFVAIIDGGFFNVYFPYLENDLRFNYVYNMMDCFECGWKCIYKKPYCITNIKIETVLETINNVLKSTEF